MYVSENMSECLKNNLKVHLFTVDPFDLFMYVPN